MVCYFDYYFVGVLFDDLCFDVYIDMVVDVCMSVIVNCYFGGWYVCWVIVVVFGDELLVFGDVFVCEYGVDEVECCVLVEFGFYLNYNVYGECVGDLYFDLVVFVDVMLLCIDLFEFVCEMVVFVVLCDGYCDDMVCVCVFVLLCEVLGVMLVWMFDYLWVWCVIGMFVNEWMCNVLYVVFVVLLLCVDGGLVVSVCVFDGWLIGVDEFCCGFVMGGGCKCVGGINYLLEVEFDVFVECFEVVFWFD